MTQAKLKKPWTRPEIKRLAPTDEILNLFASAARDEAVMPGKRSK